MTNNTLKFVRALHQKKHRTQENFFLVEGAKSVLELIDSDWQIEKLFYTERFENQYFKTIQRHQNSIPEVEKITKTQLEKITTFQTNDMALAVVRIPLNQEFELQNEFVLALADIRDPGNLGTIIRIADWYGIAKIMCSENCVDWYNPKTIAASMGSFVRVKPFYTDLQIALAQTQLHVFGAFMEGKSIHEFDRISEGILLIGNESQGIPKNLAPFVNQKITIPRFGQAESLNAGIATAIICDNIKRSENQGFRNKKKS